jgi:uncharacterized protein YbjQ (UPF0145 family)
MALVNVKKLAESSGVDLKVLQNALEKSDLAWKPNLLGQPAQIDEDDASRLLELLEQRGIKPQVPIAVDDEDDEDAVEEIGQRAELNKQRALEIASIPITSGFSFEGYAITRYSGYISGDEVLAIPQSWFVEDLSDQLIVRLKAIRRRAILELKEAAYALGCNAVVGLDFDYIAFESSQVFGSTPTHYMGVTANGNAVVIERL